MWWIAVMTIALIYGLVREIRKLPPPQPVKTPEDFEEDTTRNTMLWIVAGTLVILTLIGLLWYWQRRSDETFDVSPERRSDETFDVSPEFPPSDILADSLGTPQKRDCAVHELLAEHNNDSRALKEHLVDKVRACMKDQALHVSDPRDCNEKQRLFDLLYPEDNPGCPATAAEFYEVLQLNEIEANKELQSR